MAREHSQDTVLQNMDVEFQCLVLHLRNRIRSTRQCLRFDKNEDVEASKIFEVFEVLKLQSQTLPSLSSERLVTVTAA